VYGAGDVGHRALARARDENTHMRREVGADGYENPYGVGNMNGNTRLIWWVLGIVATLVTIGVVSVGQALYTINGKVEAIGAKVDFLIQERQRYRSGREP